MVGSVKKSLCLLLCLLLVFGCLTGLPVSAAAEETGAEEELLPAEPAGSEQIPLNAAASGSCGDNVVWDLYSFGTLDIYCKGSGSGVMNDYNTELMTPWMVAQAQTGVKVKTVHIHKGVSHIGSYAFFNGENNGSRYNSLTSLIIDQSEDLRSIGAFAFTMCPLGSAPVIPPAVTWIGEYAFYQSPEKFTSVDLPASVSYLGYRAFSVPVRILIDGVDANLQQNTGWEQRWKDLGIRPFTNPGYYRAVDAGIDVWKDYDNAFALLQLINDARQSAGRGKYYMSEYLMERAMKRAAETAILPAQPHTLPLRPNGTPYYTAYVGNPVDGADTNRYPYDLFEAEFSGVTQASGALKKLKSYSFPGFLYMDGDKVRVSSFKGLLQENERTNIGIGCVQTEDGVTRWVVVFGVCGVLENCDNPGSRQAVIRTDLRTDAFYAKGYDKKPLKMTISAPSSKLNAGASTIAALACNGVKLATQDDGGTKLVTWKSGDTKLLKVNAKTGTVTAGTTAGSVTLRAGLGGSASGKLSASRKFTVTKPLSGCTVKISDRTYTGEALKPAPTVKDGTAVLKKGTDYTVTYQNNTKAGTAKAVIKGKGSYTGTKTVTFTIAPAPRAKVKVTGLGDRQYTGKAVTPDPVLKYNGKTLKKGTDYTVSYQNNTKIGTAKVILKGKGNYTGTVTKTFRITDPVVNFVTRLYQVCLDRDPEEAGLAWWVNRLKTHQERGGSCAWGFFDSTEFKNHKYGDSAFLDRAYKAFFDRKPDTAGKNYWLGEMQKGMSRKDVILNGFAVSNEFKALCMAYSITP